MSTYGMLFERKESGAPRGAGKVVTVKLARLSQATIGMGNRPGALGGRMGISGCWFLLLLIAFVLRIPSCSRLESAGRKGKFKI